MTKTIALALAATLALGTTAATAATEGFGLQKSADEASSLTLDLVRSENGGSVQIFDFASGERGVVLGDRMVSAGANNDVRINFDRQPFSDVIAVLYDADGNVTAERRITIQ